MDMVNAMRRQSWTCNHKSNQCQYSITSIETSTARTGHGLAPNSEREFTTKDRRLYGSSAYTMHKRRPIHGSGGE